MNNLFDRLREMHLPQNDFAIFGSGPLLIRGWIDASNDLDVICREQVWDTVSAAGERVYNAECDVTLAHFDNGLISFGTAWGIGQFDVPELIDGAEIIDGLPFVMLQHVVTYKRVRGSAKDLQHLELIRRNAPDARMQ